MWTAALTDNGYGQLRWKGERRYAHHVSWELHKGPIPKGKQILHGPCDTKNCIRPSHIHPGTRLDNAHDFMQRMWERHNTRKLTPEDVKTIRAASRTMTKLQIAKLYPQVGYKAIARIVSGEYWRHVK